MNPIQRKIAGATLAAVCLGVGSAHAGRITGGNATLADADRVLDIVFVIDTSGSMGDDGTAIGNVARLAIEQLDCPNDIYVRASFYGIEGTWAGVFDQRLDTYLASIDPTAVQVTNQSEDNGPAVNDVVNIFPWFGDGFGDTTGKTTYKAVVTIGDEGTQQGSPVDQADWDAAVSANQAAIADNVFLFTWAADQPADDSSAVSVIFRTMSEGGTAPGSFTGTCGDTGGAYLNLNASSADETREALQRIICTAGSGGTGGEPGVPVPAPLALLGIGLAGLGLRKFRS